MLDNGGTTFVISPAATRRGDDLLNVHAAAEVTSAGVEAISLWGIDPLPVADISTPHRW
jgi:hypothetical protein